MEFAAKPEVLTHPPEGLTGVFRTFDFRRKCTIVRIVLKLCS